MNGGFCAAVTHVQNKMFISLSLHWSQCSYVSSINYEKQLVVYPFK
jgi:hypothetical protein